MAKIIKLEDAMREAVYVSDKVSLQTAVHQKKLVIISSDSQFYAKMLKKFPAEKLAKKAKNVGKVATGVGAFIALGTLGAAGGLLLFIGLIGYGAGNLADNYRDYAIRMDYDNRQVQMIKVKGDPRVKV